MTDAVRLSRSSLNRILGQLKRAGRRDPARQDVAALAFEPEFYARITAMSLVEPEEGEETPDPELTALVACSWRMVIPGVDGVWTERDPLVAGSANAFPVPGFLPALNQVVRLRLIGYGALGPVFIVHPLSSLTLRHGKLTADWDPVLRPNWVLVQPCDEAGNLFEGQPETKVYLQHPHATPRLSLQQLALKQDLVIGYLPEEGTDEEDRPLGTALPLVRSYLFGKVTAAPEPGSNHVMVTVVDAQGNDLGYPEPIKCWLSTPTSNAGFSADLQVDDVIWIDTPQSDAGTGTPEAMAINVPLSDHKVLVNSDDEQPGFLGQKLQGAAPFIETTVVDGDTGKAQEIRHIGPGSYAATVDYLGHAGELLDLVSVAGDGSILIRQLGFDAAGHFTWEGTYVPLGDLLDVKVKASAEDTGSGFLNEKLGADETWIHANLDDPGLVVLEHVGAGIAGVVTASGDDWITVDWEFESDERGHVIALQPLTVLHGGDGTAVVAQPTLTAQNVGDDVVITPYNLTTDARGHVTAWSVGTPINLSAIVGQDIKVKASATDPSAGFLSDKLDGDGTWISVGLDSPGLVMIDHVGPGPMTTSVAVQGNDAWILGGAANAIQLDDKGHVFASAVLLTHGGDGIAGIVTAGGDDWITVDWEFETDARGHVIALQDLTVLHGGAGIATTFAVSGDAWITGTGELSTDARGHVTAVSSVSLAHGGAGIAGVVTASGDDWITVDWEFETDAKGHVTTAGPLTVLHGGPGTGGTPVIALEASYDAATFTLTLTPKALAIDAKGHVASFSAGAPIVLSPIGADSNLQADESWLTIQTAAGIKTISHIGAGVAGIATMSGDDWITVDGELETDERGHVIALQPITVLHGGDGLAVNQAATEAVKTEGTDADTIAITPATLVTDERGHVTALTAGAAPVSFNVPKTLAGLSDGGDVLSRLAALEAFVASLETVEVPTELSITCNEDGTMTASITATETVYKAAPGGGA